MCKCVPVRSFARFKPNKVSTEIPDFLWSLAREDASGQNLWTVLEQRYKIPAQVRAEEEEEEMRQREYELVQEEAVRETQRIEEERLAKLARQAEGEFSSEEDEPPPQTAAPKKKGKAGATGAEKTMAPGDRKVQEVTAGLPPIEAEVPTVPAPPPLAMGVPPRRASS